MELFCVYAKLRLFIVFRDDFLNLVQLVYD